MIQKDKEIETKADNQKRKRDNEKERRGYKEEAKIGTNRPKWTRR